MKIAAIGDPHGNLEKIRRIPLENVDLALITGDLGEADLLRKLAFQYLSATEKGLLNRNPYADNFKQAFLRSYETALKLVSHITGYCPVFMVRGNADISNYDTRKFSRKFNIDLPFLYDSLQTISGVRLIDNKIAYFQGIKIGGLKYFTDISWAEEFELASIDKIRKRALWETEKAERILNRFGTVDILVTHVPPYGIMDRVNSKITPLSWIGRNAGSKTILEYIKQKRPGYVFCGHIHEGEGIVKWGETEIYNLGAGGYRIIEL